MTSVLDRIRVVLIVLVLIPLVPLPAHAQTTLRVPTDYPTIQAAIDAAKDADIVSVAPGTYRGPTTRTSHLHGGSLCDESLQSKPPAFGAASTAMRTRDRNSARPSRTGTLHLHCTQRCAQCVQACRDSVCRRDYLLV